MKKVLLSYCSGNYKDSFDFVIRSWVENTTFDKIIVYTDTSEIKYDDPRVQIIKFFDPNSSWIVGTGRRLEAIKDYILYKNEKYDYLCFLDIDCYITRDFPEVFDALENYFDVGLTRLVSGNDHAKGTATAGVFFLRNSLESKKFIIDWISLAEEYKKNDTMLREHKISYVQYSFTQIAFNSFHNLTSYKILNLSEKVYNSERSDLDEWYDDIRRIKPKILHFKGNRYQNKEIVDAVFSISKDFEKKEQKVLFENNLVRSVIEPEFIIDKKTLEKALKKSEFLKDIVITDLIKNEYFEILKRVEEIINNKIKQINFHEIIPRDVSIDQNKIDEILKKVEEIVNNKILENNIQLYIEKSSNKIESMNDTLKSQIAEVIDDILVSKSDFDHKKIFNRASQLFLYEMFKEKFLREVFPFLRTQITKKG